MPVAIVVAIVSIVQWKAGNGTVVRRLGCVFGPLFQNGMSRNDHKAHILNDTTTKRPLLLSLF